MNALISSTHMRPLRASLLPSRWRDQVFQARETYLAIPDANILHGFRVRAGMTSHGVSMGGWCEHTSEVIFGQLLSGLASLGHALNDPQLTQKAIGLFEGWRATIGSDGNARMSTYGWDKLVGGIVDLAQYGGYTAGLDWLRTSLDWAATAFSRERTAASELDWDGRGTGGALEWYTLGENLLRAYAATGDGAYRDFAAVWRYPDFWNRFTTSAHPTDVPIAHAYSHVNSLCSLALAARVDDDAQLQRQLIHGVDYILGTQCFATGGYGPWERLLPPTGQLGRALDLCCDHAEVGCGSWAGFKLASYLMDSTGAARWADWSERLLYNVIGAALPVQNDGRTTYYADYRLSGGMKLYYPSRWPCCSGTYLQAVAGYHDLTWFSGPDEALHVAVYLPSEVEHRVGGQLFRWTLETAYPAEDTIRLRCRVTHPTTATLRLRVPSWSPTSTVTVGGETVAASADGSGWITVTRTWTDHDALTLTLSRPFWLQSIDAQDTQRCALLIGPVVLAQEGRYAKPFARRHAEDLSCLEPADAPLRFRVRDTRPSDLHVGSFRAYQEMDELWPYRIYHDLDRPFLYGTH